MPGPRLPPPLVRGSLYSPFSLKDSKVKQGCGVQRQATHKARALLRVSEWVCKTVPLATGQVCGPPRGGTTWHKSYGVLREAEHSLVPTSWTQEGSPWLSVRAGQTVSRTAESQIRGGAVGCVLAPGGAAVPVAVGLMAHVGSTFLHPVLPRRGSFGFSVSSTEW